MPPGELHPPPELPDDWPVELNAEKIRSGRGAPQFGHSKLSPLAPTD
jgi:hypothetical protein